MYDYREVWKIKVARALNKVMKEAGLAETVETGEIIVEIPPKPEMGDLGFPMFAFAKRLRQGPPRIAQLAAAALGEASAPGEPSAPKEPAAFALGPYLNVRLNRGEVACAILEATAGETFGRPGTLAGRRIMVEFSSPNTNKPLHLGHLRNDVLGESVSRLLAACGAEVRKVCIINDRGIHICKSMLAYQEQGGGKTPESEGVKSDHFVGEWYVAFSKGLKAETDELMKARGLTKEEAEEAAPLMQRAREMLRRWEAGDAETAALWRKMNGWTVAGMKETWKRTGVSFDQFYFESETYLKGREEILRGLEKGLFYRGEDGAVWVDLSAEGLDKKALLRKDGTSLYITQDIGTALLRYRDWPFDRLIFVVGSEQQYHFKVLFKVMEKLGFPWAKHLYHLSYGMVNLPEGKMKSREGTVVDADDLIDSLRDMALAEIRGKDREEAVGNPLDAAEKVALGALHYYLLQNSPGKDMLFDPNESLSFNGNTGPYLQYMGARISSLLKKIPSDDRESGVGSRESKSLSLLTTDPEWELIKLLGNYNDAVAQAAAGLDPSVLTGYLYDLSKAFSRFYHDCPVLQAESEALLQGRLALCRAVLRTLKDAFGLTCIPFLESM